MNKENKLVPEFRFPTFKNEGEWEEKVVSQLAEYENGKAHEQDINVEGKYVVVNSKFISTDGEVRKYTNSANCIAQKDDILMVLSDVPNGRAIAKCFVVDRDNFYTVNQRICKLTPTNANSKILYYLLNRNAYFLNFDDGVKQTNLRNEDVLNCPLILPKNPKEQQKIASCISSLDEVIASHSQKLDLLKHQKKGLMQNLFPQESATVPKYRFKEFEQDGVWVDKTIDDVCKLVRGPFGGALKKEIFVKEGYAVYEQSHAIYSNFSSFRYFIDEDKFNELKRFSVKSGDLIMSCSGTMGKFAIVPEDCKIGVINQALLKLSVKKGYDKIFVKMTLEADNNQEKLLSQSAGGAIKNVVSVSQIKELGLLLPSIKEQQKIASCLSSLDALITAQAEKIEQLKLHKKGLMQGLFPKIND